MTVAEMIRAEVKKFLTSGDAPTPKPAKPASDELREKRLAALAKAREAKKAKAAGKPAAKPAKAAAESTKQKAVPVPSRSSLDPVKGKRFVAEAYVSQKGSKSILLGNGTKSGRLVFHDRNELVEWLNEARAAIGVDAVALADLHFGG